MDYNSLIRLDYILDEQKRKRNYKKPVSLLYPRAGGDCCKLDPVGDETLLFEASEEEVLLLAEIEELVDEGPS